MNQRRSHSFLLDQNKQVVERMSHTANVLGDFIKSKKDFLGTRPFCPRNRME